ncbi:hypothetical protein BCR39DRAFT_48682 [Naematelia encephala]|uniref:Uncharacterized protein n=1 Tax=Naematelia encephala TaxID=71784 RepID=A0A1Y2AHK4_9TREE|nr:hypothetical protein BCR39DRAFT_48682 [Naematelia encephala]
MSTSDSRSQAASHRSTALESQAHQAVYLSTLKQFGVRWTSLRERLGSGSGTAPLGRPAVRERVVETMPGWVQKLEDVVKPSSPPLLSTLYDVISEFDELDISLQSEKAWTKPALKIFEAIWSDNLFKVSECAFRVAMRYLAEGIAGFRCRPLIQSHSGCVEQKLGKGFSNTRYSCIPRKSK